MHKKIGGNRFCRNPLQIYLLTANWDFFFGTYNSPHLYQIIARSRKVISEYHRLYALKSPPEGPHFI